MKSQSTSGGMFHLMRLKGRTSLVAGTRTETLDRVVRMEMVADVPLG